MAAAAALNEVKGLGTAAVPPFMAQAACFFSLDSAQPARIDFYRGRVVDGLSDVVHARLFAVEIQASPTDRGRPGTAAAPERGFDVSGPTKARDHLPVDSSMR